MKNTYIDSKKSLMLLVRVDKKYTFQKIVILPAVGLMILFLIGCAAKVAVQIDPADLIINEEIISPTEIAPLNAVVKLKLSKEASVKLKVVGKNGPDSDILHNFNKITKEHDIQVLGLYGGYNNTVVLMFYNKNRQIISSKTYTITTKTNILDLPKISIDVVKPTRIGKRLTLVSYFGFAKDSFPNRPFIFDRFGDVRWYLDYSKHEVLNRLRFDHGPERLKNGNLYFGDLFTDKIFEVDMFGNVIDSWDMDGYGFHHQVLEKPNGNFLVLTEFKDEKADTVEDQIIEIDRNSKEIIRDWDLRESLDQTRFTLKEDKKDWFHGNGIMYDPVDDSIIVSGRTQGMVKLTNNNELVWILGMHKGWLEVPNGNLPNYLLNPLDSAGELIKDQAVLDGDKNHSDFEWNWYQHAPKLLSNGDLLLFDNGDTRNFIKEQSSPYSRAVIYDINKKDLTVKQVWNYGKERREDSYSRIVSDVDYLVDNNSVVFSSGAMIQDEVRFGRMTEVDYETKDILFEVSFYPIKAFRKVVTFTRTERLNLYP